MKKILNSIKENNLIIKVSLIPGLEVKTKIVALNFISLNNLIILIAYLQIFIKESLLNQSQRQKNILDFD
jgi:hypothetical protein